MLEQGPDQGDNADSALNRGPCQLPPSGPSNNQIDGVETIPAPASTTTVTFQLCDTAGLPADMPPT